MGAMEQGVKDLLEQQLKDLQVELSMWLGLAAIGGIAVLLTRWLRPELFKPLLPAQRHRAVPWTGFEIALGFFLTFIFIPVLAQGILVQSGLLTRYYGHEIRLPTKEGEVMDAADRARVELWGAAVAFPWQLVLTLGLFLRPGGAQLYQLGISTAHAARHVILAVLTWLWLSPAVLIFHVLVIAVYIAVRSGLPEMHMFTELTKGPTTDLILMVMLAVVAAPIVEELYFRGILQPWAAQSTPACSIVVAAGVFFSLRFDKLKLAADSSSIAERFPLVLDGIAPALFLLILLPGEVLFRKLLRNRIDESHAQAIYATSLLFAGVHSNVWPTPIALFPLSLGLGWLAYRTQGVIAPVVCHGLFNMISAVVLLVAPPDAINQKVNGKGETTAGWRAPSTSTSSAVPGASFPRRMKASAMAPSRGETMAEVIWPASLSPQNNLAPRPCAKPPAGRRRPPSVRLTWPRSRARTIGSWPRKQPFV